MNNYNLEESSLIKKQITLSLVLLITVIISITLSYNELKKMQNQKKLITKKHQKLINQINRIIALLIAIGYLIINIKDKKTKTKYQKDTKNANLQITVSLISLISAIIVLYIAFQEESEEVELENPED